MIRLESEHFGCYRLVDTATGQDLLIQSDWDWPSVASNFGWQACPCGDTDGTVKCAHRGVSEMIQEAGTYLDDMVGEEVEDPGYFDA